MQNTTHDIQNPYPKQVITVLLVEDDKAACEEIKQYFDNRSDIKLLAVTDSACQALTAIREKKPDAVILDLELHMGEGSGISFLSGLSELPHSKKPFILVTTHNSSQTVYQAARQLGADYILYKHRRDYSPQLAADVLTGVLHAIPAQTDAKDNPSISDAARRADIHSALDKLCINAKLLGYNYLTEAIEAYLDGQTKNISFLIAQKHGKTPDSVERAMQHAINRTWNTIEIDTLLEHYQAHIDPHKGVPTVMEFVAYYANKVSEHL